MKKYIAPELEIAKFECADVITVSGGGSTEPVTLTEAGVATYNGALEATDGFAY